MDRKTAGGKLFDQTFRPFLIDDSIVSDLMILFGSFIYGINILGGHFP